MYGKGNNPKNKIMKHINLKVVKNPWDLQNYFTLPLDSGQKTAYLRNFLIDLWIHVPDEEKNAITISVLRNGNSIACGMPQEHIPISDDDISGFFFGDIPGNNEFSRIFSVNPEVELEFRLLDPKRLVSGDVVKIESQNEKHIQRLRDRLLNAPRAFEGEDMIVLPYR